jgi:PAS domain S-box-containing protein
MLGCITDLTSQKLAEARLAEQAALIDLASDAIMVRDLNQRVLSWNRSAETIYGWSEEDVRGKSVLDFLIENPHDLKTAEEAVLREGVWSGEVRHLNRRGGSVTVFARWTLVRDDEGNPRGVLAINTDVTERKALEQQFLRSQRMESIGTLAGGIAHDLNNVLAPILLSVEMLKERIDDDDGRTMLETVRHCAQRGAELIKQVLTFARGNEGKQLPLNPAQIVREVERIIYDTFPRNIHCEFKIGPDLLHTKADPTQLHQLLMNLCVNARDAMAGGGALSVRVENHRVDEVYSGMNMDARPGAYVVFTVSDTGVGIPHELHDRIFEPFFSTKNIGQGSGLGLSTTFAIVKDYGGFLNMESEPGKGSIFRVYLPAISRVERAIEADSAHDRLPVGHGELILVVDDEENIRDVTRKALQRFGYRVLTAENGAEGVSLYVQNQHEVAVVLTDMSMPVMDGPAMIFALRTINPAVQIIGSSGLAAEDRAASAGVERFVPKPYTASVLLHILKEMLAGQRPPETVQILILISERDERDLCHCMLESAGYPVLSAASEKEADELLDGAAAGVRLLIVDARLAVSLGKRLSDRAYLQKPDFRVLLLAGAEDDLPTLQAGIARSFNVFEKPLRVEAFTRKVQACLAR